MNETREELDREQAVRKDRSAVFLEAFLLRSCGVDVWRYLHPSISGHTGEG